MQRCSGYKSGGFSSASTDYLVFSNVKFYTKCAVLKNMYGSKQKIRQFKTQLHNDPSMQESKK